MQASTWCRADRCLAVSGGNIVLQHAAREQAVRGLARMQRSALPPVTKWGRPSTARCNGSREQTSGLFRRFAILFWSSTKYKKHERPQGAARQSFPHHGPHYFLLGSSCGLM
jgi:hypothetical protein